MYGCDERKQSAKINHTVSSKRLVNYGGTQKLRATLTSVALFSSCRVQCHAVKMEDQKKIVMGKKSN